MSGKDVCVVGSGDNHAAFAFAGMGASVTPVDISERRLAVASERAKQPELPITFVQADAVDLNSIGNAEFDLVFSSNGFFVWIADLQMVFREIHRTLRPGGHYVSYDIHLFQLPWKGQTIPIEVARSYWETGQRLSGGGDAQTTSASERGRSKRDSLGTTLSIDSSSSITCQNA